MKKLALLFAFASILLSTFRPAEASPHNGLAQTETAKPPAPSPQGETPTPTATAGEAEILSRTEMLEKGLVEGDAIRVRGEYKDIPVDVTFAISESQADRLPGHGLRLRDDKLINGLSPKEAVLKAVNLGFYNLYLKRNNLAMDSYPFEQYLADFKAGKDVGAEVGAINIATGEFEVRKVDPATPLVLVTVDEQEDPNGNAPLDIVVGEGIGFYWLSDGSLKAVEGGGNLKKRNEADWLLSGISFSFGYNLILLAAPLKAQQGIDTSGFFNATGVLAERIVDLFLPPDPTGKYKRGDQVFLARGE